MLRQLNLLAIGLGLLGLGYLPAVHANTQVNIEFIYDYQCPYCHAMYETIQHVDSANISVDWRPVAIIHNPLSLEEATAAIVAKHSSDAWSRFQDATMAQSHLLSEAEIQEVMTYFNQHYPGFISAMHSQETKHILESNTERLDETGAQGVPVTIIYPANHPEHAFVLQGEQSPDVIGEAINEAEKLV